MLKVKKISLLLSFGALAVALFGGGKIPYFIFYMIGGGIFISFIWFTKAYRNISGYQKISNHKYYAGDKIKVTSYIDSDTILPIPYMEISDKTPSLVSEVSDLARVAFLKPLDRWIGEDEFTANYRGMYNLGPLEIKITDMFGMFTWSKCIYSNTIFKVYPRVYNLNNFKLNSMQSFGTLTTQMKAYEDNTSISDIKKYSLGDSVKKIHWKVSAKKGNLYVKNYELTGSASCNIFLDFHQECFRGEYKRQLEERAIESTASIIFYLLKRVTAVDMFVNSAEGLGYTKGRDVKELNKFMDILCRVESNGTLRMKDVLEKRIKLINRGSSIVIVTGTIEKEDAGIYCRINDMGYDVSIIYAAEDYVIDKNMAKVKNSGIKIYNLKHDSDVKGVIEGYEN